MRMGTAMSFGTKWGQVVHGAQTIIPFFPLRTADDDGDEARMPNWKTVEYRRILLKWQLLPLCGRLMKWLKTSMFRYKAIQWLSHDIEFAGRYLANMVVCVPPGFLGNVFLPSRTCSAWPSVIKQKTNAFC
jgi:hypothetical protein